ncbi:hypothetical protein D3C81_1673830 [compost metagenome]
MIDRVDACTFLDPLQETQHRRASIAESEFGVRSRRNAPATSTQHTVSQRTGKRLDQLNATATTGTIMVGLQSTLTRAQDIS